MYIGYSQRYKQASCYMVIVSYTLVQTLCSLKALLILSCGIQYLITLYFLCTIWVIIIRLLVISSIRVQNGDLHLPMPWTMIVCYKFPPNHASTKRFTF